MLFGETFQTILDAVFAAIYTAITIQYSAFFTLLELFQTLFGAGTTV